MHKQVMEAFKWLSDRVFPSEPHNGRIGSLDFNLWLAQISGVPLNGLRNEHSWVQLLALIYGVIALLCITVAYFLFEVYDLILNIHNLDMLTQNSCLSLTHLAGLYKIINTFNSYSNVKYIIEQLRHITKCYVRTAQQKQAFDRGEFANKVPLMIYATLVTFTAILGMFMLFRNPAAVAGKIFPYRVYMPSWLPFSIQLPYMGISVMVYALQIVAIDYLNITMMNQICLHLQILNLTFDELSPHKSKEDLPNMLMQRAVRHHCELRSLGQLVEQVFSTPVLIQFVTSLFIFAMTGFQAIVKPSGTSGALLIYFYCGCILCELFLYCWFGNEVHEQSKTLAASVFKSPWYQHDRRFKKSLLVFLINAQKPFLFTAGGFVGLSLPSFTGILSKSYSILAILRQVYSK